MGKIFTVGIGAIMAVFSIRKDCGFKEQSLSNNEPNSVKPKCRETYGNAELNCMLNNIHKCVETRGFASFKIKDGGIVQALKKFKGYLNRGSRFRSCGRHKRLADHSGHNRWHVYAYDTRYWWLDSHTAWTRCDG